VLKIRTPAKINLFLYVTGKRSDGYHELVSLMCPVSLYDTLTIRFGGEALSVECDDRRVPQDETNLAYRAARAFWDRVDRTIRKAVGGVRITIEKRIPVGAGLGGGSSNAAGVLLALNRHFENPISMDALYASGLSIGADVPFFIYGKAALARGVGEKLRAFPYLNPYVVILIFPGFSVSTKEVFQELNFGLTKPDRKTKEKPFTDEPFDPRCHLHNDLEAVTARRHAQIFQMKQALEEAGADGALMTGSGPSVFGLFESRERAERTAAKLTGRSGWSVFLADTIL